MQYFCAQSFVVLCTITSFANAAYHPQLRRYNRGHHSHNGSPDSTGGLFPSGSGVPSFLPTGPSSPSALYPAGNTTAGSLTGSTGRLTRHSTRFSQVFVTAAPSASVASSSIAAPERIDAPGAPGGGSGALGSAYGNVAAVGESASTCGAAATTTITNPVTVTVTASPTPSQAPIESQTPFSSPAPATLTAANSSAPATSVETGSPVAYQPAATSSTAVSADASSAAAPSVPTNTPEVRAPGPTTTSRGTSSSSLSIASLPPTGTTKPPSTASGLPSTASLTPNGVKAGIAGYVGITQKSAWSSFTPHIGWYSDYTPNTPNSGSVTGVPMLWGDGHLGGDDATRLSAFKSITTTPKYMMGFYEPDFTPPDSSSITSTSAATTWSTLLEPLRSKGTLLGSPSLAKQKDETWLTPFEDAPEHPTWDFTCIHTNKNSVEGVKEDVDYYLQKYGKPIWVSEFACVDDSNGFTPCTDQSEINGFIKDVVQFLQFNKSVVAYGYSNGDGLGDVWPLVDAKSGGLSASGQAYLSALQTSVEG